jgi:hypothetical protein
MPPPNTDEKATAANSRLTFDRGLGFASYPAERIDYVRDKQGKVSGTACTRFDPIPDDMLELDRPETQAEFRHELERQFQVLHSALLLPRLNSTSCLLKAAASFHQLLLIYLLSSMEDRGIAVAGTLLDIFREVERRTKQPYQYKITLDTNDLFQPLPRQILTGFPLGQSSLWQQSTKRRPTTPTGAKARPARAALTPVVNKEDRPVDQKELDRALENAEKNASVAKALNSIPPDGAPLVRLYVENLKLLTLEDVYRQTNVSIKNHAEWKLSQLVEVIFYASYMTLVLDANGEPFDGQGILGLFPYGMILPSKKFKTVKLIPPPGRYVSLGPLAGQQFSLDGGTIQKLPVEYSGIIGFQEVDVTGHWTPDYQEEANKVLGRNKVYLGSLVVESAYSQFQKEITLSSLYLGLQDMVDDTLPYLIVVVAKKVESWFENYEDFLKDIGEQVIRTLVIETLKDLAKWYVIKKVGKRVIPVINAVAAVKDMVGKMIGEDDEPETIAVNCVRLYLKGTKQDDRTLSAKIMANIMGDAFEAKIKQALIDKAVSKGVKLVEAVKHKASKRPPSPTPPDPAKAPPQPPPPPSASKPPAPKSSSAEQDVINKGLKAFQDTYKPPENQRETENKAANKPAETKGAGDQDSHDRATSAKATSHKGNQGTGKTESAAGPIPSEPPLPPRMPGPREKFSYYQQNRDKYPPKIQIMLDRYKGTKPSEQALNDIRTAVRDHARAERLEFYVRNRAKYAPDIQGMLDRLKETKPTLRQLADVDFAIRKNYARDLFKATGIPFDPSARISPGSGGDWEKINRAERTGVQPRLEFESHTKSGDTVQIDDFDAARRIPREYKASLQIKQKSQQALTKDLSERMKKHAQFAEDYNLAAYEWVAHSNHSESEMTKALSQLKGEAMKEQNKEVREALLRRYGKIRIVNEPVFDEE